MHELHNLVKFVWEDFESHHEDLTQTATMDPEELVGRRRAEDMSPAELVVAIPQAIEQFALATYHNSDVAGRRRWGWVPQWAWDLLRNLLNELHDYLDSLIPTPAPSAADEDATRRLSIDAGLDDIEACETMQSLVNQWASVLGAEESG